MPSFSEFKSRQQRRGRSFSEWQRKNQLVEGLMGRSSEGLAGTAGELGREALITGGLSLIPGVGAASLPLRIGGAAAISDLLKQTELFGEPEAAFIPGSPLSAPAAGVTAGGLAALGGRLFRGKAKPPRVTKAPEPSLQGTLTSAPPPEAFTLPEKSLGEPLDAVKEALRREATRKMFPGAPDRLIGPSPRLTPELPSAIRTPVQALEEEAVQVASAIDPEVAPVAASRIRSMLNPSVPTDVKPTLPKIVKEKYPWPRSLGRGPKIEHEELVTIVNDRYAIGTNAASALRGDTDNAGHKAVWLIRNKADNTLVKGGFRTQKEAIAFALKTETPSLLSSLPSPTPSLLSPKSRFARLLDRPSLNRWFHRMKTELSDMGPSGKGLSTLVDDAVDMTERQAGQWGVRYEGIVNPLSDAEWNLVRRLTDEVPEKALETSRLASGKVQKAASDLRQLWDEIWESFGKHGGTIEINGEQIPVTQIQGLPNWFPHIFDPSKFATKHGRELMFRSLREQGASPSQANHIIQRIQAHSVKVAGNLEIPRAGMEFVPRPEGGFSITERFVVPGYRTDRGAGMEFISRAAHRLAFLEKAGPGNVKVNALLKGIADEGGDAQLAEAFINSIHHRSSITDELSNAALRTLTNIDVITKIGQFTVTAANASQPYLNLPLVTSLRSLRMALQQIYGSEEGRIAAIKLAKESGALTKLMQQRFAAQQHLGSKVRYETLRFTGFTPVEFQNRLISSVAGKIEAEYLLDALKQGNKLAGVRLQRLGLDPDALLQKGVLEWDDFLAAAQQATKRSQFRSSPLDLPSALTTGREGLAAPGISREVAQVLYLYKSFGFQQAALWKETIKDMVKDYAVTGSFSDISRPLLWMAAVTPGFGYFLKGFRAAVRTAFSDEKFEEAFARPGVTEKMLSWAGEPGEALGKYIDLLGEAAGFGVMFDAMRMFGGGMFGALRFLGGPVGGGLIPSGIAAAGQLVSGKPGEAARTVGRQLPAVGRFIPPSTK